MLASRDEVAAAIGTQWQQNATCINAVASASLVHTRPRALAIWLCLVQSMFGVMCGVFCISTYVPSGITCREVLWMIIVCIRINDLCASAILLQKAYIVTNYRRWIFIFALLAVAAPAPIVYASWSSPAIMSARSGGCAFIYPSYYPWLRFAFHAPMNIALTLIFVGVAYLNVVCTFAIAFEIIGLYSIALTLAEWCISSTLLVAHVGGFGKGNRRSSERRQYERATHDEFFQPQITLSTFAATLTTDVVLALPEQVDVLIVGGGIAGLANAYALARAHPSLHILVAEQASEICAVTTAAAGGGFRKKCKIICTKQLKQAHMVL
ncbi:hypothetical protein THASP1DRAFT_24334, partial [Thamnocephalis sphaerospora]